MNFLKWFTIYDKQIVLDNMLSKYIEKKMSCFTKDVLDTLICCWPLTLHLQQILSLKYVFKL